MLGKQKESQEAAQPAAPTMREVRRNIAIAVLILAAFVLTYYLGRRRRSSRLDAFAQCLASKQAKMYGAYWCPHCADEERMFGSSFKYVPYVECGVPGSRAEAPACKADGIKHYPTWVFASGDRREGTLPLQTLGQMTGCGLP
jgi:hypothetical protein